MGLIHLNILARWVRVSLVMAAALAVPVAARAESFAPFPTNSNHSQAAVLAAIANVPPGAGVVHDALGNTQNIQIWNYDTLVYTGPVDISTTLDRIRHNYWIRTHGNDGSFFNFWSPSELPNIPRMGNNYYMEFVVWPSMDLGAGTYDPTTHPYDPALSFPGPMRILLGAGGEVYFTGDHYGQSPAHLPAYYVNPTSAPEPGMALLFVLPVIFIRRRQIIPKRACAAIR
jgi:hypothetical protein